ncbi:hypothetical protein SMICM304S_03351 [Streptomyces microflavus]
MLSVPLLPPVLGLLYLAATLPVTSKVQGPSRLLPVTFALIARISPVTWPVELVPAPAV